MAKGGAREGAGRPKGVPNKVTADIKALAQSYTEEAMAELIGIVRDSESDAAKVAAIKEIFDRGFGKAKQSLEVEAVTESYADRLRRIREAGG